MKKILIILMLVLFLVACSENTSNENDTNTETNQIAQNTEEIQTEEKVKKTSVQENQTVDLEQEPSEKSNKIIQVSTIHNPRIKETIGDYTVYIYSENEEESTNEDLLWSGTHVEDLVYHGDYRYAIAENDSDEAILQEHIAPFGYTFFDSQNFFVPISDKAFAIIQYVSTNIYEVNYFEIDGLELKQFDSDEMITTFTTKIKEKDDSYIQLLNYDNSGIIGYSSHTYKIDRENSKLIEWDTSIYSDETMEYGYDTGVYFKDLWFEHDDYIHVFYDTELVELSLERMDDGYLFDSYFAIGDSKADLISELGEPFSSDYWEGAQAYVYNDYTYYVDGEEISAIAMNGHRVKAIMTDIIRQLGTPVDKFYDEIHYYTYVYKYIKGNYRLWVESPEENGQVTLFTLRRK